MRFPCLKSTRIPALIRPGLRVKKIIRSARNIASCISCGTVTTVVFSEDGCFNVKQDVQCNWIYINEAVYVEEQKVGRTIGQRTYTWSDRRKYVGEWKDGNPWLGIEYDKDGNVTAIYVEGIRTE